MEISVVDNTRLERTLVGPKEPWLFFFQSPKTRRECSYFHSIRVCYYLHIHEERERYSQSNVQIRGDSKSQ